MTITAGTGGRATAAALASVRERIGACMTSLVPPDADLTAEMLDTAAAASELAARLLELVCPCIEDREPGTGEALERAGELIADTRRHVVTAMSLSAGATAIAASVRKSV